MDTAKQRGTPLPYLDGWRNYEYLTQGLLAEMSGLNIHTIKCLESARYQGASHYSIQALAGALHITARQLVEEEPPARNKAMPRDSSLLIALEPFVAYIVQRVLQELQAMDSKE